MGHNFKETSIHNINKKKYDENFNKIFNKTTDNEDRIFNLKHRLIEAKQLVLDLSAELTKLEAEEITNE